MTDRQIKPNVLTEIKYCDCVKFTPDDKHCYFCGGRCPYPYKSKSVEVREIVSNHWKTGCGVPEDEVEKMIYGMVAALESTALTQRGKGGGLNGVGKA